MEGIVYVLTNPAMPKLVKIGKTSRGMSARLNELYSTGVPLPFECVYAARVADESEVERAFHRAFGPNRVNAKREFFEIEPEQAIALLQLIALEDVTPEVKAEAEQVDVEAKSSAERLKSRRRQSLNFIEMGIPAGSQLLFDDGEKTCTVLNGRRVEYDGGNYALSTLTAILKGIPGQPIRGSSHWTYQGRNLADMYEETYSAED